MAGETKDQMQERFEAVIEGLNVKVRILEEASTKKDDELKNLKEGLTSKDTLIKQQKTRIAELNAEGEEKSKEVAELNSLVNLSLSDDETGPATDEPEYDGPEPEWRDVDGTVDQLGRLQALSIGRMDRPGVLLRYLTASKKILSCAPYRDAKMVAGANESTVSLSYAG